uniref:Uncharacterized protein n=1 Tax=Meloidogyne enterolobii TaxID=390850 RepID=A0A6V7XI26_MELEN|nr:unnamed protein product [Meloidogyne enterolobii]
MFFDHNSSTTKPKILKSFQIFSSDNSTSARTILARQNPTPKQPHN